MREKTTLLQARTLKDKAWDFTKIREDKFIPSLKEILAGAKTEFNRILENSEHPNFENTIRAYCNLDHPTVALKLLLWQMNSSINSKKLSEAKNFYTRSLTEFFSEIENDRRFFKKVKVVYDERNKNSSLSVEEKRFLEVFYEDLTLNGALLSEEKKKELKNIATKLSSLSSNYMQNGMNFQETFRFYVTDEKAIKNLPENVLLEAKQHWQRKKIKKGGRLQPFTRALAHL